jgi:uncharacterized repeat protein (TIGR01451 family)
VIFLRTMKTFSSLVLFAICYLLVALSVNADVSSQPIYGGGQMSVSKGFIFVDKKIQNPVSQNNWVDNLNINDPKYQPDSPIIFQINLTNTGNLEIKNIIVKDVFPQYVSFSSGPGSFDSNAKILSFDVKDLKPNESRTFTITGKIVPADQLPIQLGSICMVNQVTASANDSGTSQDNALFCIQKEILGTQDKSGFPVYPPQELTSTPATGPETLLLFSLLPAGITGWLLRKYTK